MSLIVTLDPAIAIPARQVRLLVTDFTDEIETEVEAENLKAQIYSAPTDSQYYSSIGQPTPLDVRLDVSGRVGTATICFVPDVAGIFQIDIFQITQARTTSGSGRRNSFQGAADGYAEAQTLQFVRYSLKVAQRMTTQLGANGDFATLALYVVDDTIQTTTAAEYGEDTPSIISSTSERARVASISTDVLSKVSALAGITTSTALGSLSDVLEELTVVASEHLQNTDHQMVDENGAMELQRFRGEVSSSSAGVIEEANRIRSVFMRHWKNDSSDGLGMGLYHSDVDGYGYPDLKNLPIAGSAVDVQSARILTADLHRSYEAHRVQIASPPSHLTSDTANTLSPLPAMLALDSAFLSVLASSLPSTPAESNPGVVRLVFGGGFRRATP